jgi:hypothetical protein
MAGKPLGQTADGRMAARRRPGAAVFGLVLVLALVGLVPFAFSTPAKAGTMTLYVSALGWSEASGTERRPGPAIVVYQGDIVTITMIPEDLVPQHRFYIDYNANGRADTGEPASATTSSTTTFSFTADRAGTFQYADEVVPLNVGSWATKVNSAPTATIRAPSPGASWTGGVSHSISIDVTDPDGDPVQVWVNYSYGGGASQPIKAFVAGTNPNLIAWTPGTFSSASTFIRVDVKDNRGGAAHIDSSPFEVDSTAPTIDSFFPASAATGVPLDMVIRVNWSEPMNRVTAADPSGFGVRVVSGPWLKGTGVWSTDGSRFIFQPSASLNARAQYEIHANMSATDHSDPGNAFAAGPLVWTFTAGSSFGGQAPPAPTSVSASPTEGGVDVTWTSVSFPNIAGYHVYRGPSATGPFVRLTTSLIPVTGPMRYRDPKAQSGQAYTYAVTAVNATGGESAYATAPAVTIPTYQTPPLFDPVPWAVAGVTLGVILGALYGLAWRRKPA